METAGPGNHRPVEPKAGHELTFKLDHSAGAAHEITVIELVDQLVAIPEETVNQINAPVTGEALLSRFDETEEVLDVFAGGNPGGRVSEEQVEAALRIISTTEVNTAIGR